MENHGFSAVLAEKPCLINAKTVWIPLPHAAMILTGCFAPSSRTYGKAAPRL
jgi:hypothetical protein